MFILKGELGIMVLGSHTFGYHMSRVYHFTVLTLISINSLFVFEICSQPQCWATFSQSWRASACYSDSIFRMIPLKKYSAYIYIQSTSIHQQLITLTGEMYTWKHRCVCVFRQDVCVCVWYVVLGCVVCPQGARIFSVWYLLVEY